PFVTEQNRRRGQLSWILRAATLVDVDCWTRVLGEPLRPGAIHKAIRTHVAMARGEEVPPERPTAVAPPMVEGGEG
ncbi:MAG TPA: hypothetical protein VLL48_13365, partial [Longimicrobiales bacterium]|nr:hypothetical protein [Longimicrobiales bacterium]